MWGAGKVNEMTQDGFCLGGRTIKNRFFLGTGKFASCDLMRRTIEHSGVEVVTVALRRVDPDRPTDSILAHVPEGTLLVVNTSGARTAAEAVRLARMGRAAGCGDWVKIEIMGDQKYLLPDNQATVEATRILASEGFVVLPYMFPDLYVARDLVEAGAAAVMPLGAPIGTNRGLLTRDFLSILRAEVQVPVIVDAGIGRPSQAAEAMELGCDAVLANTAVALAEKPDELALAFSQAVSAGRRGYLSGLPPMASDASPSSPLEGLLFR